MINFKRNFAAILLLPIFCYCQVETDSLLNIWNNDKLENSIRANAYKEFISKNYYENKTDSAYIFVQNLIDFTDKNSLKKEKADALIFLGDINHIFNDNLAATNCFKLGLKIYNEIGNKKGKASALNSLGVSFRKIYKLDEALKYYEKSLQLSRELKDTTAIATSLLNIGTVYLWRYKNDKALDYFNQSLLLSRSVNNQRGEVIALNNIASAYNQKKEYKTTLKIINEAIKTSTDLNNYILLSNNYSVLCQTYLNLKNYNKLIKAAELKLGYAKQISHNEGIDGAYYFLFKAYKGKKNFDLTMKYLDLRRQKRTTMEDIASSKVLEKINIDNEREKDSIINLAKELKASIAHKKEKTNLTLTWGSILVVFSLLAYIVYRSTKRKQHKAEKERQDQIDEKEKILKDLELTTIDAMIEGQEKERKRLASDLHDSVGATLVAAKLQFEYLVKNQNNIKYSEDFLKKTSTLLEDAYVEIRSLAHLKNSGVMAKNGLLPAIRKLSKNASGVNDLTFEVISHGIDQRIENTLEISIFRIIQELVTNIIKHANASEATIHLTNHENSLNIMVEDNGVGFDTNHISNKGMGIHSIDKRIEHLEGTMAIESEINKGTTVIIDIPL